MENPSPFRELVSGQRTGVVAALMRTTLRLLAIPYWLVTYCRNRLYDRGLLTSHRVPALVISVGNLTVGGTGKTPLVLWLIRWCRQHGRAAAVVSRGYKARDGQPNDEAMEMAARIPGLVHVQHRDRVAAAHEAIRREGCDIIVLDDGFQHRRIHRDLDVVLLDALEPFGWDHVLPRGTLREPVSGLARADVVALSRADAISAEQRSALRDRARRLAPAADWIEVVHQPIGLIAADGQRRSLDYLRGRTVAAFCGIGNPQGFLHTLHTLGCRVTGFRALPDHYAYPDAEVARLARWVETMPGVDTILCTCKDLVKLEIQRVGPCELWAVEVGLEVSFGKENLDRRLRSLLANARGTETDSSK